MKSRTAALLLATAFLQSALAQSANDDAKFRALERKMFDASIKAINGNDAELRKLLDADYYSINADGSTDDAKSIDYSKLAAFHLTRVETSDFKLRHLGNDVAIINGISRYFSGDKLIAQVRHTQVWVNRAGEWKFASWQGTMLPAAQASAQQPHKQ
jgi:hypothetical protein